MDKRTWYIIIAVLVVLVLAWLIWPRTAVTPVDTDTTPPATTTP